MIRAITPTPIPPAELARDRTVQVRDALRAIAGLTHDGAIESWCDHPDVSRGDLAALFALLGDRLDDRPAI